MSGRTWNTGLATVIQSIAAIPASPAGVTVRKTSPSGAKVSMRTGACLKSHECLVSLPLFAGRIQTNHKSSYWLCNWFLLRILGVTVIPLGTLETLRDVTQTRKFPVCTIRARNGIGILPGKHISLVSRDFCFCSGIWPSVSQFLLRGRRSLGDRGWPTAGGPGPDPESRGTPRGTP